MPIYLLNIVLPDFGEAEKEGHAFDLYECTFLCIFVTSDIVLVSQLANMYPSNAQHVFFVAKVVVLFNITFCQHLRQSGVRKSSHGSVMPHLIVEPSVQESSRPPGLLLDSRSPLRVCYYNINRMICQWSISDFTIC